jgi:hypothetical protein
MPGCGKKSVINLNWKQLKGRIYVVLVSLQLDWKVMLAWVKK